MFGGGSGQQRFPSKKYKTWLKACPELPAHNFDSVTLEYRFYFPDNRNRDSENYVKAVSDFLVKACVLVDDNWHVVKSMLLLPMGIDRGQPRIEIVINPI
jgi:Holliday junction resolvase RusA-like endonuclease